MSSQLYSTIDGVVGQSRWSTLAIEMPKSVRAATTFGGFFDFLKLYMKHPTSLQIIGEWFKFFATHLNLESDVQSHKQFNAYCFSAIPLCRLHTTLTEPQKWLNKALKRLIDS